MTKHQAMTSPLSFMDEAELKYVHAFCQGEVMRAAQDGPQLDYYEARRKAAERELEVRRGRK